MATAADAPPTRKGGGLDVSLEGEPPKYSSVGSSFKRERDDSTLLFRVQINIFLDKYIF